MKLSAFLLVFFIAMVAYVTVVVSHESGHYVAAKSMGYAHARIHSTHTDTGANPVIEEYKTILNRNRQALKTDEPFPEKDRLLQLNARVNKMADSVKANNYNIGKGALFIYAGGPLVTILIGIAGILILFFKSAKLRYDTQPVVWQWVIVFAFLTWIKPVYELAGGLIFQLAKGHADILTDEYKISSLLGIYPWTINIIEALISVFVLKKIFSFIPPDQKGNILVGGVSGGIAGYIFMHFVGPVILP